MPADGLLSMVRRACSPALGGSAGLRPCGSAPACMVHCASNTVTRSAQMISQALLRASPHLEAGVFEAVELQPCLDGQEERRGKTLCASICAPVLLSAAGRGQALTCMQMHRHLYNQVFLPRMRDWLLQHVHSAPAGPAPQAPGKAGRAPARMPLQALTANQVNAHAAATRVTMYMR